MSIITVRPVRILKYGSCYSIHLTIMKLPFRLSSKVSFVPRHSKNPLLKLFINIILLNCEKGLVIRGNGSYGDMLLDARRALVPGLVAMSTFHYRA